MKFIQIRNLILKVLFYTTIVSCHVDKHKLRSGDFRLFQDTQAWQLAKAVREQDTIEIEKQIKGIGIPVDFQEETYGQSLLHLAVQNELCNSCKKLLNLGADPNHSESYSGSTPMHDCVNIIKYKTIDDTTILSLLIKHGGNPNGLTQFVQIPGQGGGDISVLMIACRNTGSTINRVKYLVEKGADVNFFNSWGNSVVSESLIPKNYEVLLYLLKSGKLNYKGVRLSTISEENYIQDMMRNDFISLESPEYKFKLEVIDFLMKNGIDYKGTPIPERLIKRAKDNYPDSWKEYLSKY